MTAPKYDHSMYLRELIRSEEITGTVKRSVRLLRDYDFDAIAFRGMSGALIAPILAMTMGKTLIMVRKSIANGHSNRRVEGDRGAMRYIIADDLVDTGRTVQIICKRIRAWNPEAKCVIVLEACRGDLTSQGIPNNCKAEA